MEQKQEQRQKSLSAAAVNAIFNSKKDEVIQKIQDQIDKSKNEPRFKENADVKEQLAQIFKQAIDSADIAKLKKKTLSKTATELRRAIGTTTVTTGKNGTIDNRAQFGNAIGSAFEDSFPAFIKVIQTNLESKIKTQFNATTVNVETSRLGDTLQAARISQGERKSITDTRLTITIDDQQYSFDFSLKINNNFLQNYLNKRKTVLKNAFTVKMHESNVQALIRDGKIDVDQMDIDNWYNANNQYFNSKLTLKQYCGAMMRYRLLVDYNTGNYTKKGNDQEQVSFFMLGFLLFDYKTLFMNEQFLNTSKIDSGVHITKPKGNKSIIESKVRLTYYFNVSQHLDALI